MTCLIYAINIADRYVVSTVLEPIRLELHLNDAGVAFLTGIPLALFYVTFGLPISWLADRSNRRNILASALVIWSAFTVLCGMSRTYWQFLLGRIGVGVGEAGGLPPSSAILSDCFPAGRRPMAFTVLALGAPIGAWLGADMAGAVAHAYGWRAAFLALGAPGLIVGVAVYLTIREPVRGRLDAAHEAPKPSMLDSLRFLLSQRAAVHVLMTTGVCSLWGWGLIWWTPTFLMRTYGLNVGEAGAVTGPIHLVGGILASLGTAWLLSRRPGGSAPGFVGAGDRRGVHDHPIVPGLLDAHPVGGEVHVLDLHSRDLFLYRSLHGTAAESGAASHAIHVHRLVVVGGKCLQSDRRTSTDRNAQRSLRGRPRRRRSVAAARFIDPRTRRILGHMARLPGHQDGHRGPEAGGRVGLRPGDIH